MPPAAAVCPRKLDGSDQNTEIAASVPHMATASAMTLTMLPCVNAATIKPPAPTTAASETWRMRSPARSLDRHHSTVATLLAI